MTADVLIAGAGPAGAVAAYVLARAGRRVVMVDEAEPARAKIGESLPGAARPLLRDLGLSSVVDGGRHAPCYGNVSAWGSADLVATDFIRDPHGPGWHLDRSKFDADLRAAARDAGVECRAARVTSATRTADRWSVTLSDGQTQAAWLIDATGRRAVLARRHGGRRRRDDRLVALYAWAATGDAETRTLVESTPDGWWYTARIPGEARVAVLHVDAEDAAAIHRVPGTWEARLARTTHVRRVLEGARWLSAPRAEDAGGARLERFAGAGWLAVGDAALSFDPLSSQGIFTALYTGMKAGAAVDAALSGASGPIEAYAARLESIRAAYLGHWRTYYGAERRWPHRRFWARRHLAHAS
jgi:flavin-dependent dehydrogenase